MKHKEFETLLKLIALNGKDVGVAVKTYLKPSAEDNINHVQAKMLGWIQLLNIQTRRILDSYDELPVNKVFQGMVDRAFQAYIIEGEK